MGKGSVRAAIASEGYLLDGKFRLHDMHVHDLVFRTKNDEHVEEISMKQWYMICFGGCKIVRLNESFVFRALSGFSCAGAKHHQKKSLITFLAIFGSPFYVGNGAGQCQTNAETLLCLMFKLAAQGQGGCIGQE